MNTQNRGFTLLELTLVLGAIATFTAGGFYVAQRNTTNTKAQTDVQTARTLSTVLAQSWGQSGSFDGINSKAVAQVANRSTMRDAWGGAIDFTPTQSATAYSMTFNAVPSSACVRMATQLARDFASVEVNQTALNSDDAVSSASDLCNNARNAVTLNAFPVAPLDSGEVPLPKDRGAVPKLPAVAPATLGARSVQAVKAVAVATPVSLGMPHALGAPTVSSATAGGVSSAPVNPGGSPGTALPPGVALPPQTCFPSVVSTPAVSTVYQSQTLACQAGYAGSIAQQQSAQKTVTTTKTTTCASAWSVPQTMTTTQTDQSAWSAWATTSNTCAPMCSTQLASYPAQTQYQWVTVNQGCPAGYAGTKSYQALQASTRSASCANPSGTGAPAYGAWSAWANTGATQNAVDTCAVSDPVPSVPVILTSAWGSNVVLQPQAGVSSYQMGLSCFPSNPTVPATSAPVASTIQSVSATSAQNGVANWVGAYIFVPQNSPYTSFGAWGGVTTIPAQIKNMTSALPQSSCAYGAWGTSVPVQVWVRACNASGQCSGWSAPKQQFCSYNKC